jgi:hypothetical protein
VWGHLHRTDRFLCLHSNDEYDGNERSILAVMFSSIISRGRLASLPTFHEPNTALTNPQLSYEEQITVRSAR